MELIRALRFDQSIQPPRVAFVGAGGKTTAIFDCARQLSGPVLITATAHLAEDQLALADQHFFANDGLLYQLEKEIPPGSTLITGFVQGDSKRTLGLSDKLLERIHALANMHQIPLLVESDGSQQLALKAPADHEPPIPEFVDMVVVVAGLTGLGKPLNSEWVHRPEIFSALSGLQLEEIVTTETIAKVLTHPQGGLKNIPPQARRMVLLNQADTAELQAQITTQKSLFLQSYHSMIVSSLTPDSTIHAVHQPISAVILAAGGSRRFGSPKQLLDWHGKPLIWHVAQKALRAGLNPVIVVCGSEKDSIQRALEDLPVELVHNPDWQRGQGTSVKCGVQMVGYRGAGILFFLADQPQIPDTLIQKLINVHAQRLNPITGPMVDGQRANPVLFDRVTFEDLLALSGEEGGRKLFGKFAVDWTPWHDPAPLLDVDTPEDYVRLLGIDL
ncbi:selenium cofactor biosynthesis protein YqeC [Chloroflexota bacterium]